MIASAAWQADPDVLWRVMPHVRTPIALLFALLGITAFAGDARTPEALEDWKRREGVSTVAFEQFLASRRLDHVVPLHQLLRSASDWKKCQSQPFAVPPESHWPQVESVLRLLGHLKQSKLVTGFEIHSAYRDPQLNDCANGVAGSAHTGAFALDLTPIGGARGAAALCSFWKREGANWDMGLGRYASGRIHIDTSGYRSWGNTGTDESSTCR